MAEQDQNFMQGLEDLLGMDDKAVERLIDQMDDEPSLTALRDAVASGDQEAAENIVRSFDTDEEVNPLFRGKDIDDDADEKKPPKNIKRAEPDHQFSFGDSVYIMKRDESGKKTYVGATVNKPEGPHDTVGLKIDGKPKMIDRNRVFIEEGVLGMVGVPNLERIQQLAGLAPSGNDVGVQVEQMPQVGGSGDPAVSQAMAALDSLESALPNVRLADLKDLRQRIVAIQACMNESVPSLGRAKKL